MPDSAIYLITGPMAAGKTTVARLLAGRFDRGVHLEGDFFRRSIVAGREEMTPDASSDAVAQLRLRYRLAANVADHYCDDGYTVALEDVVAGPLLSEYVGLIRGRPLYVVVLLPTVEAIVARETARRDEGYSHWSAQDLHNGFAALTPRLGLWLDTSSQTAEQTVGEILSRNPAAVVR